jgi:hypothetical protein
MKTGVVGEGVEQKRRFRRMLRIKIGILGECYQVGLCQHRV